METTLSQLRAGQTATVQALDIKGPMRRRLQDLGLLTGTRVDCVQCTPRGGPGAYLIRGACIALRREDTGCIRVRVG